MTQVTIPVNSYEASSLTQPLVGAFAITPSDTVDLIRETRAIYAAGAGNISVVWQAGDTTTEPVAAGERLPWRIVRVRATGTTATGIRGFY